MYEPERLVHPGFTNRHVGRQAAQRLQMTCEVVGGGEVDELLPKLIVAVVIEPPDCAVFDRTVHLLDLTVRPAIERLG